MPAVGRRSWEFSLGKLSHGEKDPSSTPTNHIDFLVIFLPDVATPRISNAVTLYCCLFLSLEASIQVDIGSTQDSIESSTGCS